MAVEAGFLSVLTEVNNFSVLKKKSGGTEDDVIFTKRTWFETIRILYDIIWDLTRRMAPLWVEIKSILMNISDIATRQRKYHLHLSLNETNLKKLQLSSLYLQGSQKDGLLMDLKGEEEERQGWIDLKVTLGLSVKLLYLILHFLLQREGRETYSRSSSQKRNWVC